MSPSPQPAHCSFEVRLTASWPPELWRDVTVVAAVSGGADSVALLRSMSSIRGGGAGRLVAAHFNHGLRGEEAEADERFVRQLAMELGIDYEVGRWDHALAQDDRDEGANRSEEDCRAARYAFLTHTAGRLGARFIATAHTADDMVETVLHRIIRGTGLRGLAGIPRSREILPGVALIRPLLSLRRSDVLGYLHRLGQSYREDCSNVDVRYTRNRIRHELLPLLAEQYNPQVFEAIARLANVAGEAQQSTDSTVAELMDRCVHFESPRRVTLDISGLASVSPHLIRELFAAIWKRQTWPLQAMGFDKWDELALLIATDMGQRVLPGGIVAKRKGSTLALLAE